MALSLNAPTGSTPRPTNTNGAPNPADRYALWFFAGTLVVALVAAAWSILGL
ncbi:MAG: hypothetical protein ABJF88_18035 [Rhodothermales bacterium]